MSGASAGDLVRGLERDVREPRPVVVDLDGQRRSPHPERCEQLGLRFERLPGRDRLDHLAVGDPPVDPFEGDLDQPRAGLQTHVREPIALAEHERGPEHRVARERELDRGREDPDAGVGGVAVGREHEHGLGQIELARRALHQVIAEPLRLR